MRLNYLKIFSNLLTLSSVFLICYIFINNFNAIKLAWFQVRWIYIFISGVLLQVFWFNQVRIWARIYREAGGAWSNFQASVLFFTSQLLSFLPGRVLNLLGTASKAKTIGVEVSFVFNAMLMMQVYGFISYSLYALLGSIIAPNYLENFSNHTKLLTLAIMLLLIAFTSLLFKMPLMLLNKLFSFLKIKKNWQLSTKTDLSQHIMGVMLFFSSLLFLGASLSCILFALGINFSVLLFFQVLMIFGLAKMVGILAVFGSSNLGITDLGLLFGLSFISSDHTAFLVVAIYRLLVIVTSLCSYFIFESISKYKNRYTSENTATI